ncbi:MAG: glycosyltransferase family 9 protein [Planctomycetes bacterium]|nr:glycosyltransferase family 9 protein [Planctomycetota bacterium]
MRESRKHEHIAPLWPRWLRSPALFSLYDSIMDRWHNMDELRRFSRRELPEKASKILVVRDRGFGDILQLTTILDSIRTRFFATRLDFLTSPQGVDVLAGDRRVDRAIPIADYPDGVEDDYDLYINFHIFPNSAEAVRAVKAMPENKIVGRTFREGRDEKWYEHLAGSCWLRKYCRIADVEFTPDLPLKINIARDGEWEASRKSFVRENMESEQPYVAVCLGGLDWRRNYAISFLDSMITELEKHWPVLLVGLKSDRGEAEREELSRMLKNHPQLLDLTDRLSLRELLYAIESSSALVTCDTGPLHMAIGVGTPLVAIFGHTPGTQLLGPLKTSDKHAVITPTTGCKGCGFRFRESCFESKRAECMERIDIAEVVCEVRRFYRA